MKVERAKLTLKKILFVLFITLQLLYFFGLLKIHHKNNLPLQSEKLKYYAKETNSIRRLEQTELMQNSAESHSKYKTMTKYTYPLKSLCQCSSKDKGKSNQTAHVSSCSQYSTERGYGQKIVAYSLYNTHRKFGKRRYLLPLFSRIMEIKEKLPGWIVRVYTPLLQLAHAEPQILCSFHCNFSHVDICDVDNLPPPLGRYTSNQSHLTGMAWRFMPLIDPLVDIFISRDADSYILDREISCLNEWLESDMMFHALYDHPWHGTLILGGLWGAKNWMNRNLTRAAGMKILFSRVSMNDLIFLVKYLQPEAKSKMLCHSSYNCEHLPSCAKISPFPTQRQGGEYTGSGDVKTNEMKVVKRSTCPPACRPNKHKDWTNC